MLFQITFWTVAILSLAGTVLIFSAIAIGALKPEGKLPRIERRGHWTKGISHPGRASRTREPFLTINGKDRHV